MLKTGGVGGPDFDNLPAFEQPTRNPAKEAPAFTLLPPSEWGENDVVQWIRGFGPDFEDDAKALGSEHVDGRELTDSIANGTIDKMVPDETRRKAIVEGIRSHAAQFQPKTRVLTDSKAPIRVAPPNSGSGGGTPASVAVPATTEGKERKGDQLPAASGVAASGVPMTASNYVNTINQYKATFESVSTVWRDNNRLIARLSKANITADDQSQRFASVNEMGFDSEMKDGFGVTYEAENERIVVDATTDAKLKALIPTTHSFLHIFRTEDKRASALAKLVVQRFGGGSMVAETVDRYNATVQSLRQRQSLLGPSSANKPVEVPLGSLIEVGGMDRHCAILFKYLADRTLPPHVDPAEFGPPDSKTPVNRAQTTPSDLKALTNTPASTSDLKALTNTAVSGVNNGGGVSNTAVSGVNNGGVNNDANGGIAVHCRLSRRWISDTVRTFVIVRVDGVEWYVDMFSTPPRLVKESDFTLYQNFAIGSSELSDAYLKGLSGLGTRDFSLAISRPAQKAARVAWPSLQSSRVDVAQDEFTSIFHDARVVVKYSPLSTQPPAAYDVERFTKECDVLATSLHASIIRVRAICTPSQDPTVPKLVFVRDPLEAQPLCNVLGPGPNSQRRDKRWTFERVLHVGVQLAEALSELHLFGLTYEEVTTANLLITPVGDIKIGEFAASRYLLQPPPPPVHFRYKAPELWEAQKPSEKTDVWAFGCVLYAIATGSEAWGTLPENEVKRAILTERKAPQIPADLKLDSRLSDVIRKCLSVDPTLRPLFDEVAASLKAIVDATKKMVPVSQVAPFGFASLSDTNFGSVAMGGLGLTPALGTSLVDSRDAIRLRQKLQPMSDDSITVARERFCASLGTIDPFMIVAKRVDAPSFYVVHRNNGNVALVTCGLWDPNEVAPNDPTSNAALPGIELVAEAKESECENLSNSWLYQCLLEVACTAKRNGTKLRRLLRERSYATMEVMDVKLPSEFLDPTTGRACMLLGVDAPTIPKHFMAPNNVQVNIVTARLLTLLQWRDSQEFAVGKKPLAAKFNREDTHHLSSLVVPPRTAHGPTREPSWLTSAPPSGGGSYGGLNPGPVPAAASLKRGGESDEPHPSKYSRSEEGHRTIVPSNYWTVERLKARLDAIQQSDAIRKPGIQLTNTGFAAFAGSGSAALGPAGFQPKQFAVAGAPTAASLQQYAPPPTAAALTPAFTGKSGPAATASGSASSSASTSAAPSTMELFEALPDVSEYEPPVPTGVIVTALIPNNPMAAVMSALTSEIRHILAPNSKASERMKMIAQTVYGALGTQSQLYGWQHVSEYIRNPQLYIERTKSSVRNARDRDQPVIPPPPTMRGPSELHEAVDTLQETGHSVIKRLIQRIEWLVTILRRQNVEVIPESVLSLLGTDVKWMDDATGFMNSCEYKVAELLTKNPQRFNQFRDLQKKGVQWPHSPDLRKEIEKAGFVFRPMMIKRDRCVCDVCGAEVSGWRPWHDPRNFHDYSRHPASYRAERFPNDKAAPDAAKPAETAAQSSAPNPPSALALAAVADVPVPVAPLGVGVGVEVGIGVRSEVVAASSVPPGNLTPARPHPNVMRPVSFGPTVRSSADAAPAAAAAADPRSPQASPSPSAALGASLSAMTVRGNSPETSTSRRG
jgi:serine/threonine protein kinase